MYAYDDDGKLLDARYEVERDGNGLALVLASRSGKRPNRSATNPQYTDALLVLLWRLKTLSAVLDDALVDSEYTRRQAIPDDRRRIIDPPVAMDTVVDVAELCRELKHRQGHVALSPDAKRKDTNQSRQIRLRLNVPGFGPEDANRLADVLAYRNFRPVILGEGEDDLLTVPLPSPLLQFPPNAEERSERATFDEEDTDAPPLSEEDARKRVLRGVFARQGQGRFRGKLMIAYGSRCAVTGCDVTPVLEAAHLYPYKGLHTNHVTNGLLLRADIHTLLDCQYLAPNPETLTIVISKRLHGSQYEEFDGRQLADPVAPKYRPAEDSLKQVWQKFHEAEQAR